MVHDKLYSRLELKEIVGLHVLSCFQFPVTHFVIESYSLNEQILKISSKFLLSSAPKLIVFATKLVISKNKL